MLIILGEAELRSPALILVYDIQLKTFINIEKSMFQKRTSDFLSCLSPETVEIGLYW
jgi:hypothetical protein